jgi:hypothetical protein
VSARTKSGGLLDVPVIGPLLRASLRTVLRDKLAPKGADERLARVAEGIAATRASSKMFPGANAVPASGRARLLFILSTERSGSTLFSLALGRSPHHVTPPEMHLLAYPSFEAWREDYPTAIASLQFLLHASGIDESDDDVAARFAGWKPEAIYRWILGGHLDREKLFIDKTPKYARDPATLSRIESLEPRYIWLVRHPLAVAASQIALRRERSLSRATGPLAFIKRPLVTLREQVAAPELLEQEVAYWRALNTHIESFLAGVDPARWRRVSLEHFVREPEKVLREISAWLGSDFDPAMLDPRESIPREMRPELGDPKVHRHQKIDPAVADAWRADYTDDWLDGETRSAMARWGVPTR